METKEIIEELELNYGYKFNPKEKYEFDWLCNLIKDVETVVSKNESLHLVSESDIKDVTEKWVKSMLHSDEIKEDDCRYNFNHGVRIGIELSKKANSH